MVFTAGGNRSTWRKPTCLGNGEFVCYALQRQHFSTTNANSLFSFYIIKLHSSFPFQIHKPKPKMYIWLWSGLTLKISCLGAMSWINLIECNHFWCFWDLTLYFIVTHFHQLLKTLENIEKNAIAQKEQVLQSSQCFQIF